MGNIVWMASYPKSGNTWLRAFLQNYLSGDDQAADINRLDNFFANESNPSWYLPLAGGSLAKLDTYQICKLRPAVHSSIAASKAGTVMVKTHNMLGAYEGLPLHNMSVTSGAICVVRNPLDVVISVADHFGLTVNEAIEFMSSEVTGTPNDDNNVASVLSSWSSHVTSWTRDDSGATLVLKYEDMLDKPQKQFSRVLSFLGLERKPARLKSAIKHSSFSRLRKQEDREGFKERSPNSRKFFRSGRKNQWREILSEEQIDSIVERHRDVMTHFNYLPPVRR